MVLTFPFLNALRNSPKSSWQEVVKKHYLTPQDLQKASEIVKAGKLEDEWFNRLYIECTGARLLNSDKVFDKYGIVKGRELLKLKLRYKLNEEWDKRQYKGD